MRSPGFVSCALISSILSLVVACDLQPPPKKSTQGAAPADAPAKQPGNVGKPVSTEECLEVGTHFAQVLIDTSTDPAEKAILEQERARNVRRQGEVCEANNWDESTRSCFLRATTRDALQACIAVAPRSAPTGSAAGSVAPAGSASSVAPAAGSAASAGSAAPAAGSGARVRNPNEP